MAIAGLLAAQYIAMPSVVEATFPGYNGKIAFHTNRDGNWEIYAMNVDGTNQVNLTNNTATDEDPTWSPDGSKIAFRSTRDGNAEVYVMDADGSNVVRLTNNPANDIHPTWSPGGDKIAFASNRDGSLDIYVMDADGSNQTRLTTFSDSDTYPTWSPDGERISYDSRVSSPHFDIFIMDADGSGEANITNTSALGTMNRNPEWSPDGDKLVFNSTTAGNTDIYVVDADGSNQTRLTTDASIDGNGHWSPDGTQIAFDSNRSGNRDVYSMSSNGEGITQLTNSPGDDGAPVWQPNPNATPVVTNDSITTDFNTASSIDVLANDTDEEALDPANLTIASQPSHGTASIIDNKVRYIPDEGYAGADEVTYQICDSFLLDQKCATGVLGITVQAPDAPTVTLNTIGDAIFINGVTTYTSNSARPTFSGSATPGAAIRVEINSDPIILTTTADDGGKWSVTPDQDIPAGEHTVTISATKDDVTTTLDAFVLGITAGTAAAEVPKTGATTSALRLWGVGLLAGGAGLHLRYRRQPPRSDGYVPRLFP
jgi:LPXTG-motif cell wall-anchored protein